MNKENQEMKTDPRDLINWGELSRRLSGTRSVVLRERMPKIHRKSVNELIQAVQEWENNREK